MGEEMAGSVNKVILIGNLGRDPEVRHSQDGTKIVTLSIATSENWKDRLSGERREKTEWHRVVIFHPKLADLAERYLHKGSKTYLEGVLRTRKWTDPSGNERYTTEVVIGRFRGELTLLDSRSTEQQPPLSYDQELGYSRKIQQEGSVVSGSTDVIGPSENGSSNNHWNRPPDLDDEIPF